MSLYHTLAHMIRPGRQTAPSTEDGSISRTQIRHSKFETKPMNSMQLVGFASATPKDTDLMAIHVGGDNSNGTIIASNHQKFRPTGLATGETCLYDCQASQQKVLLKADGSIHLTGVHRIFADCDTEVTITAPTVTINGNLRVNGTILAGTGAGNQFTLEGNLSVIGTIAASQPITSGQQITAGAGTPGSVGLQTHTHPGTSSPTPGT